MSIGRHRARSWRLQAAAVLAAAGTAAGLAVGLASTANAAVIASSSCEARGVQLGSSTVIAHANPANTPCAKDNATAAHLVLGTPPINGLGVLGVTTGVIRSSTQVKVVKTGLREEYNAEANVADVGLSIPLLLNVRIDAIRAQAQGNHHLRNTSVCTSGGTTYVAGLFVNNKPVIIGSGPVDLQLLPGLHLLLNQEESGPDGVTETAVELAFNGHPLVVIAQAEVGTGCGSSD